MTTSYLRLTGAAWVLFGLLASTPARGVDMGVRIGQDGFFVPAGDTTVRPTAFMVEAEFGLGPVAALRTQAGYSYHEDLSFSVMNESWSREWIDGVRIEAAPLFLIHTPLDWLSLRGGVGLGLSWYEDNDRNTRLHPYTESEYWSTRNLFAGTQTFVAGVRCEVSPRFSVLLDAERAGLRLNYADAIMYRGNGGYPDVDYHIGQFTANWDGRASNAISVALHFKL
jgi:hypothetical protein